MERPSHLYKYRPINIRTLFSLYKSEIYFARYEEFNDPFDSLIPKMVVPPERQQSIIKSIELYEDNYSALLDRVRKEGFNAVFLRDHEAQIKRLHEKTRVFTLSQRCDSPLMFAHYADGSKGICVEYLTECLPFVENLKGVDYPPVYPTWEYGVTSGNVEEDFDKLVKLHYYTKSPDWAYEKEWRIVRNACDGDTGIHQYPEQMLTAVVFGYKASVEAKRLVMELLRNRPSEIKFGEVVGIKEDFSLEIEELSI
jgi:hypothetical protein